MRNFIFVLVLLITMVSLQAQRPITESYKMPLSSEHLKKDFEVFRGTLENIHPGLYGYSDKGKMDSHFDNLAKKLEHNMSPLALYREVLNIISKIGCGHTWADVSGVLDSHLWGDRPKLPLQLKLVGDQLFCVRDFSGDTASNLRGSQITAINGIPWETMFGQFMAHAIADGRVETGRRRWVESKLDFYFTLFYGRPEIYDIAYVNEDGRVSEVNLPALTESQFVHLEKGGESVYGKNGDNPMNKESVKPGTVQESAKEVKTDTLKRSLKISASVGNEQADIVFRISDDSTVAYLNIKSFASDVDTFNSKIRESFHQIEGAHVENLILDLRGNRGGRDELGRTVLSYLVKRPLVEFDEVSLKTVEFKFTEFMDISEDEIEELKMITERANDSTYMLKEGIMDILIKPEAPGFTGNVFVLIDGRTFSTAADVAAILSSETEAVFIGEETGGGYYGNNSGPMTQVTLPNSGIRIRIPHLKYVTNVEDALPAGSGVVPQYIVHPTIEDLLNTTDPYINKAFALIENLKK